MNWGWVIAFVAGLLCGSGLLWWLYTRDLAQKLATAVTAQAKLAQQLATRSAPPPTKPSAAEWQQLRTAHAELQDELTTAEVEISDLQNKLKRANDLATHWQYQNQMLRAKVPTAVSTPSPDSFDQQLQTMQTYTATLKAQINSLATVYGRQPRPSHPDHVDVLRDIKGIGPTFALKLYEGGVYTFAQLAEMTAEEIIEIIEIHVPDIDDWQKQARDRARG